MLIQPNTYVKLIKGCPLDNSYRDTIYFEDEAEQYAYFRDYVGDTIVLPKQSYQRYADGVITVNKVADELYGVNYMMFQNSSFGNKWFYAFVNEIEYVGNVVSRIYYEIDVLQTWMFNYEIYPCFVEREHSKTDAIGDNIIPENLSVGEYVFMDTADTRSSVVPLNLNELSICVLTIPSVLQSIILPEYARIEGGLYNGVYTGLECVVADNLTPERIDELRTAIWAENVITAGGVVAVFMFPTALANKLKASNYHPTGYQHTFDIAKPTTIDGYTPKNNKLFTFPYCMVNLTNNRDSGKDFAYELFYDENKNLLNRATFLLTFSFGPNGNLICYPMYYKGLFADTTNAVQTPPFPTCNWATDNLAQWLSENSLKLLTGFATSGASSLTGVAIREGGTSKKPTQIPKQVLKEYPALADVHNFAEKQYSQYKKGEEIITKSSNYANEIAMDAINSGMNSFGNHNVQGTTNSDALFATERGWNVELRQKVVKNEYAKIIDDYFTMYGYATKRIKMPNLHVRKYWTYVKTIGFSAHGSVPSKDMELICEIHDKGITYWDKNSVVGDYSPIDNNPI